MTKEAYSTEQKIAFIKRLYCPARAVAAATGGNGFEDFMTSLHVAYYRDKADKPRTDVMAALKAPWMKMAEEEFKARVARFKGTHNAMAVSFQKWGRSTRGNKPALGAVALIRFKDGRHHVTFVAGMDKTGTRLATLGGKGEGVLGLVRGSAHAEDAGRQVRRRRPRRRRRAEVLNRGPGCVGKHQR